jgi:beta-xylosidase
VKWGTDDWPIFGNKGEPVGTFVKPNVGKNYPIVRPATSDEFSSRTLGLQWQWNHNPIDNKWSLKERPGFLRLKSSAAANFTIAPNTLTQKLWDDAGVITVKLDVSHMADGQYAGFTFMYGIFSGWIGVAQTNSERKLDWNGPGGPVFKGDTLWLRGTYQADQAHFAYSLDGKTFTDAGRPYAIGFGNWKGTRPALYSYGSNAGYIDVDYFHYSYGKTIQEAMSFAEDNP